SVAEVAFEGIVTVWYIQSVCAVDQPPSHAYHDPACGAYDVDVVMSLDAAAAQLVAPDSNPGFARSCVVVDVEPTTRFLYFGQFQPEPGSWCVWFGKFTCPFTLYRLLSLMTAFQPSEPSYTFVLSRPYELQMSRVSSADALYIASVNQVDGWLM